jgi:AsmA protein
VKKLLIGLAIIMVLFFGVVAVAPFFIPIDAYRARLIDGVKQATGRDLTIAGDVSVSVFPHLGLDADDVSLANPPGSASPDMIRLGRLEVRLKLLPLLRGRVVIRRFVLTNPVIALEVEADGRPNWVFGGTAGSTAASQAPAAPTTPQSRQAAASGADALASLRLKDIRLVNGTVTYLDRRNSTHQAITEIGMTLALPGLDQPFKATGAGVWHDQKLTLTASADKPNAALRGGTSPIAVTLSGAPVSFDLKGNLTGATPPHFAGTLDLAMPSVRNFAGWIGTSLDMPGTGPGPFELKGAIDVAGPKARFSDATLRLDGIHAQGQLSLDTSGPRPAVAGQLTVDRLDLNPYLPPPEEPAALPGSSAVPTPDAGQPGGGWSTRPIDLSPLQGADADLSLSTGGLVYRRVTLGATTLDVHLHGGRLEADLTHLAAYQGFGQGSVTLDGSGPMPALQARFHLTQMQLGPLLQDVSRFDRLSGTGTVDLSLTTTGRNEQEMIGNLDGTGGLSLTNGTFRGFNLFAMVRNLAASVTPIGESADVTKISSATASATIAKGILRNQNLVLQTDALTLSGAGEADLPARTLSYRLTPHGVVGILVVPIDISGPWSHPSYRPDLAGIGNIPGNTLDVAKSGAHKAAKGGSRALNFLKKLFGQD